jgi:hypothetical protein
VPGRPADTRTADDAFADVERRLRAALDPLRSRLAVTRDDPGGLALEIPGLEGKPWGYVAGVRRGKRYVSLYLMPVYASSELAASMSPELRRRMQGKACFNFTRVDERLFAELGRLAMAGLDPFVAEARQVAVRRQASRRAAGTVSS